MKGCAVFLISVHIDLDIAPRHVKQKQMIEWQHCGRDASEEVKKKHGRENVIYIYMFWLNKQLSYLVLCEPASTLKKKCLTGFRQGFICQNPVKHFFICPILGTKQLLNQAPSCDMHVTHFFEKTGRAAGQHSGFSASRWWMWKIPVRGPNVVSLKPDDF